MQADNIKITCEDIRTKNRIQDALGYNISGMSVTLRNSDFKRLRRAVTGNWHAVGVRDESN